MTEQLIEQTATLERQREWMRFQLAEEIAGMRATGSWHAFVRADGTKPSSFRKFLEAYTAEVRDRVPGSLSTGTVEELVAQYEWVTRMGGSTQDMALLTYEGLKGLRLMYGQLVLPEATQHVQNALAEIKQYGKFFLPNLAPPDRITGAIRLKDLNDGTYAVKGLVMQRGNVQYANNILPYELAHWLSKRTRFRTEIED